MLFCIFIRYLFLISLPDDSWYIPINENLRTGPPSLKDLVECLIDIDSINILYCFRVRYTTLHCAFNVIVVQFTKFPLLNIMFKRSSCTDK